jgi:hypothetical protein
MRRLFICVVPSFCTVVVMAACALPEAVVFRPASSRQIGGLSALKLKSSSTLEQVIQHLQHRGATGIAVTRAVEARDQRTVMHALSADHLGAVLLFLDGRYQCSLPLKVDAGTDRGLYLKLVRLGRANAVVVVSEDLTVRGEHGLRIIVQGPSRRLFVHVSRSYFPEWIYGMKDPLIVGHDLAGGVTFVARKASDLPGRYLPWHRGTILSFDGERLSVRTVLLQRLLACSCIDEWFNHPPEERRSSSGGLL